MRLLSHGSRADGLGNFDNGALGTRARGENFQAQKNDVNENTNQPKSRKEVGSPTKEQLYELQDRFRIEPEVCHDLPLPAQALRL
ncbi:MAG TPA: hypothetical protein VE398_13155 [Acidobacteriota bacterium]|nr:hypothetical protein [Acidobacteriota bacterium]